MKRLRQKCPVILQDTFENTYFKKFDSKKKNCFFITLNDETNEDKELSKQSLLNKYNNIKNYLLSLKYTYFISYMELNTKGYYHIHIFIQFNTPHKLSIKKMEGANIQIMKTSVNQCIKYIQKSGEKLDEFGNPNYITGNPSIKDIALSTHNQIIENLSDYRYYNVIKKIKHDIQPLLNCKKNVYILKNITKEHENKFLNYQFFDKDNNNKIHKWCPNMIIKNIYVSIPMLKVLFNHFNEPIQHKYYPNDVENVLLLINPSIKNHNLIIEIVEFFTDCDTVDHIYDPDNILEINGVLE